jgi:DNA-binding SARP family transcriptional activator
LIGRVARWWRVLVNATPDELVRTTPPGTAPAQSTRQPTTLALPPPAAAIVIPTASPVPPQPLADDLAASPVRLVPQHAPADELVPLRAAAPAARTGLVIYTLGDLRVFYNDVQIEAWESARARAIFRYLVAQRPAAAQKERLAALLWPDSEPELARRSLHQAIYCLRQTLRRYAGDASVIQFANDTYQLAPEIAIWVDADVFAGQIAAARAHWSAGDGERAVRAYATAADLYQGDFLANEGGEEWVDERRGAFQVMYTEALHRLAQHYYERDDHSAAVAFSQRALAHDGCDEDAHRLLMLCYAAQGLRHLAVRQYQICVAALRTQLGLEPSDEMKDLYRRLVA